MRKIIVVENGEAAVIITIPRFEEKREEKERRKEKKKHPGSKRLDIVLFAR